MSERGLASEKTSYTSESRHRKPSDTSSKSYRSHLPAVAPNRRPKATKLDANGYTVGKAHHKSKERRMQPWSVDRFNHSACAGGPMQHRTDVDGAA